MPFAIIKTKITSPDLDPAFVLRGKQIAKLDDSVKHRVTLISAAAGYGKTTLAVQWKATVSSPAAWLSVDADDNDLERFVRYLVASLRSAVPRCCQTVMELIESPQTIPEQNLVDALINDMSALDQRVFLIVDDLYLITETSIHDLIARVIEQQPECLRLVFLSRLEPPWPLPLWRVRGWVSELSDEDLRFSASESRDLVTSSLLKPVDDRVIDRLHGQTEGWPAGMRLALLALCDAANPMEAAMNVLEHSSDISDFLFEEVINGLPPKLREFLELTAPLDRFCAPLCDSILLDQESDPRRSDRRPSRELIDELQRRRLFLVSLDDASDWFRYHHLFKQLLYRRFGELSEPAKPSAICRHAGQWFAKQGLAEESLGYLIRGGDLETAVDTLWAALPALLTADLSRRTLSLILSKFPAKAFQQYPELILAEAFVCIAGFDLDRVAKRLADAETTIERTTCATAKRVEQQGVLNALQSFCFYWNGDTQEAWRCGSEALRLLPSRFRISRTYATIYGIGGLMLSDRTDESFALIERSITEDAASGSGFTSGFIACKAVMYAMCMQLDGVEQTTGKMRRVHKIAPMPDYWYSYAPYLEGLAAYERNQLDQASRGLRDAMNFGVRLNPRHYHDVLVSLSRVAEANGEMDSAWKYADRAREFAMAACDPISVRVSDAVEARLRFAQGERLIEPPPPQVVDAVSYFFQIPSLIYAELLLEGSETAEHEQAFEYIERSLALVEPRYHRRHVIVLTLLKALALEQLGKHKSALRLLSECLRWGKELGLLRTFLDRGPKLERWLRRLLPSHSGDDYLAFLLTAFHNQANPTLDATSIADLSELSQREMDVLELMQKRLSNKQIGAKLHVTSETVKKHAQSIYRKLGVNRRREAVLQAERLGILSRK